MRFKVVSSVINEFLVQRGESERNFSNYYKAFAGKFFEPLDNEYDSNEFGKIVKYNVNDDIKLFEGTSSLDFCMKNDLLNVRSDRLYEAFGIYYLNDILDDNYYYKDEGPLDINDTMGGL